MSAKKCYRVRLFSALGYNGGRFDERLTRREADLCSRLLRGVLGHNGVASFAGPEFGQKHEGPLRLHPLPGDQKLLVERDP